MSSNFKSVGPAHPDPVRAAGLYRLAIVGAGTLKGKEVAEVLGDRNFPSLDIKLLDDNESLGKLETVGDEVSFIQSVRAEQFEKIDFTFFACDQECTRQNWKKAAMQAAPSSIFPTLLEDEPGADVKVAVDPASTGPGADSGVAARSGGGGHPAAVVLALLLLRVQKAGSGEAGGGDGLRAGFRAWAERHGRTSRANRESAFLPAAAEKDISISQVAFNMVARYGEQSAPALATRRAPRAQALQRIAGKDAPAALASAGAGAHLPRTRVHPACRNGKSGGDRRRFQGAGRGARDRHAVWRKSLPAT